MIAQKRLKVTVKLIAQKLDIDEIINYEEPKSVTKIGTQTATKTTSVNSHDSVFNIFAFDFPNLEVDAQIGDLQYHKYHLKNIKSKMRSTSEHYLHIDKLDFDAADGHIDLKGYFNGSDSTHIYFDSNLKIDDADLDKLFFKFDNFGQDYLLQENIHGRISGTVKSKVRLHPDLVPYLGETEAHAEVTIVNGSLVNFPPFKILYEYMGDKDLENVRFGELTNVFDIKDGTSDYSTYGNKFFAWVICLFQVLKILILI